MTYEEAKEIIKTAMAEIEWSYPLDYAVAFEKAIEALEKQMPQKVIPFCGSKEAFACPICGTFQDFKRKTLELRDVSDYCYKCGQKLDWSDLK